MDQRQNLNSGDKARPVLLLMLGLSIGLISVALFPLILTAWPLMLFVVIIQFMGEWILGRFGGMIAGIFGKTPSVVSLAPKQPRLNMRIARTSFLVGFSLGAFLAFVTDWHIELGVL